MVAALELGFILLAAILALSQVFIPFAKGDPLFPALDRSRAKLQRRMRLASRKLSNLELEKQVKGMEEEVKLQKKQ